MEWNFDHRLRYWVQRVQQLNKRLTLVDLNGPLLR